MLRFGPIDVEPCAFGFVTALAPMANVTNPPFRSLARSFGCGLTVSEMVASQHLVKGGVSGLNALRMERAPGPGPHVVQLLGADPALMAEAARICEAEGADALDVNMGCPIRRIQHGCEAGVALMRAPTRAAAVLEAMAKAVKIPVSAKLRAGASAAEINAVAVARALEQAGAAMLTVHARTADSVHDGAPRLAVLAAVKSSVNIPVIGNGGVRTVEHALRMVRETGCDGVMIGRGALGNPWLFRALATGRAVEVTLSARRDAALEYARWYAAFVGEAKASRELRKYLRWFFADTEAEASLRPALAALDSLASIERTLDALVQTEGGSCTPP
jgi:tRNA-dihydrouridine synthase B